MSSVKIIVISDSRFSLFGVVVVNFRNFRIAQVASCWCEVLVFFKLLKSSVELYEDVVCLLLKLKILVILLGLCA